MSETASPKIVSSDERKVKSSKRRSNPDSNDQLSESTTRSSLPDEPKRRNETDYPPRSSRGSRSTEGEDDIQKQNKAEKRSSTPSNGRRNEPQLNESSGPRSSSPSLGGSRTVQREKERIVRDTVSTVKSVQLPSSSSAFTSPTEQTKKNQKVDPGDENYDDDFEDYKDDFEEETETRVPAKNLTQIDHSVLQSLQSENANALERKQNQTQKPSSKSSKSLEKSEKLAPKSPQREESNTSTIRRPKKFTMEMGASLDPRHRRLSRLFSSGILDLQEEKSCQLNILPTTPFDYYTKQLRLQPPPLRQVGVPSADDRRDVEANTEDTPLADKELQFSYGDDTTLLNVMKAIRVARAYKEGGSGGGGRDKDSSSFGEILNELEMRSTGTGPASSNFMSTHQESTEETEPMGEHSSSHSSKLSSFLQKASQLMEGLLSERTGSNQQSSEGNSTSIFAVGKNWVSLGSESGNGAVEFIRPRRTSVVRFSPLLPYLLMTAHPPPCTEKEEGEDLRPSKALYCIWDVSCGTSPSYLLESSGVPTCVAFSSSQSFLVVAGTEEGCLYLWDLRENSSIHADRDSIGMKIDRGIRKPSYSVQSSAGQSSSSSSSSSSPSDSDLNPISHCGPIVQVESFLLSRPGSSASASVVSQFASIDALGVVVLWLATESSQTSSPASPAIDFGSSPWGSVTLTQTRMIQTARAPSFLTAIRPSRAGDDKPVTQTMFPNSALLGLIPNDSSTFLVSGPRGSLIKVARFGEAPPPNSFDRVSQSPIEILRPSEGKDEGPSSLVESSSLVTCMAISVFSFQADVSSEAQWEGKGVTLEREVALCLVGRSDGSVDLFRLDLPSPIQSWDLSTSDGPQCRFRPVTALHWLPNRAACFLASDHRGGLHIFDLLRDFHSPVMVDRLALGSASRNSWDISQCRSGSRASFIASLSDRRDSGAACDVKVRKIREDLLLPPTNEGFELNQVLDIWSSKCSEMKERVFIN